MNPNYLWQCLEDAEQVAQIACKDILAAAEKSINERSRFKLVLAGGTTPEKVYSLLAQADADWPNWWIYHGDERCLPVDHKDRNSLMAASALLDHVAIPKNQIFNIPAELGPELGAQAYAKIVADALPFDLVLLGMGEDGHTASLFPGHEHNADELTHAVFNSPKPPPERVTLSAKALSNAGQVFFLITGLNKREAMKRWCLDEPLPVTLIRNDSITVMIDGEAAYG
jgi:6-phosphogluconolactonase